MRRDSATIAPACHLIGAIKHMTRGLKGVPLIWREVYTMPYIEEGLYAPGIAAEISATSNTARWVVADISPATS
jgi:hypothetical protein